MSHHSRYITRKEIGAANECSHETIRRRERALGLDSCRDRSVEKPVRYIRDRAVPALRRCGLRAPQD